MPSEKHPYEHLPLPSYEEATSSRPSSANARAHRGPEEISDDAERQGLLGRPRNPAPSAPAGHGPRGLDAHPSLVARRDDAGYRPPTARSVSDGDDEDGLSLPEMTSRSGSEDGDDEALRRDMEQMEMLDADPREGEGGRVRRRLSKRFASWTATLSQIHLPSWPGSSFEGVTSRLPRWPDRYRPGCSIIARLVGLFIVIALVYSLFIMEIIPTGRSAARQPFNPEWVRSFAQGHIDAGRIRQNLKHVSQFDHVAGSEGDYSLAKSVRNMFWDMGMDEVAILEYAAYLNYPKADGSGRSVSIVSPPELAWEAKLEEESVVRHPSAQQRQTFAFHGLSRSGTAEGPLIYANYGSRDDFRALEEAGVNVTGAIVLVRYYGTQGDRAWKVKAAEMAGAAGCVIYSDPEQDGFARGATGPDGRWRTRDSVQRGTVGLTSFVAGDVLTPGWASTREAPRIDTEHNPGLVNIPSLPLAWRDAQRLLQVLKGHGHRVRADWIGRVPKVPQWWTGDQGSPVVRLRNEQDEETQQTVWNVLSIIEGVESTEKKIIVGNHRDSWCFGAVDPGSGTAVMLEVARALAALKEQGWRPLRSIVFASWDAEEYNLIGSTEYVEDHLLDLRKNGVAYLNVDVGVSGARFHAAGSPVFERALLHALDRVGDPHANATMRELWDRRGSALGGLGAGSDYVAFQDMAGTSSIDFGFAHAATEDRDDPATAGVEAYPYHSCYETFDWMAKHGDPGFIYHARLAEIWVLLILELAQKPILPFDFRAYVRAIQGYVDTLAHDVTEAERGGAEEHLSVEPLRKAVKELDERVRRFLVWEDKWYSLVYGGGRIESPALRLQRMARNAGIAQFETALLHIDRGEYEKPLPTKGEEVVPRAQFKHVLFGPQAWSGYDPAYFPHVRDALDAGNWTAARTAVQHAADAIDRAGKILTST